MIHLVDSFVCGSIPRGLGYAMGVKMISVLHTGICSSLGGIETYLMKISKRIDKEKFKFSFLVLGKEPACFKDELEELGFRFYQIPSRQENYKEYRRQLRKVMEENDFDIVHCHLNSLSNIDAVTEALRFNHKVIVHSRNAGSSYGRVKELLCRLNYFRLPKNKIKMLAVSDYAGQWMFGKDQNIQVINNGVDIDRYKFIDSVREQIRKEFNLEGFVTLVHSGAFRIQKNHKYLIEILKILNTEAKKYKIILMGEGELKSDIQELVKEYKLEEYVLFAGIRKDVEKILSAADIFVFPSLYEGFPNALIEAEACGLPALVSDTITNEVIIPGLCEKADITLSPSLWADKIRTIPLNQNREYGVNLVKSAGLSIQSEIERLQEIYFSFIKVNV